MTLLYMGKKGRFEKTLVKQPYTTLPQAPPAIDQTLPPTLPQPYPQNELTGSGELLSKTILLFLYIIGSFSALYNWYGGYPRND